jgi:nucleoside phosphorylase
MTRPLYLFSSALERDAAFPDGVDNGALTGVTGVGLVDAGIGTANAIHDVRPDAIVFLGTCGAHRTSGLVIGDIVFASTVSLSSGDVARGEMRIPSLIPSELWCSQSLGHVLAQHAETPTGRFVTSARVSCTLGITESDALAGTLAEASRADVENLEAFAVVRAAAELRAAVILGVTNIVGVDGGRDWQLNYMSIMQRLSRCVRVGPFPE